MSIVKKAHIGLVVLIVVVAGAAFYVLRGDKADLSLEAVTGTDPQLAEPDPQMIPTVDVVSPVGWKDGEAPAAAKGLAVNRFATGLEHPRTMLALPNGDILVTLTNAPSRVVAGGTLTNLVARFLFRKAGASGPSPRRARGAGSGWDRAPWTPSRCRPPPGRLASVVRRAVRRPRLRAWPGATASSMSPITTRFSNSPTNWDPKRLPENRRS